MGEIKAKIMALWVLFWANRYFLITDTGRSVSCSQSKNTDDIINNFVKLYRQALQTKNTNEYKPKNPKN